jgi:inorganic pyrophosphatase
MTNPLENQPVLEVIIEVPLGSFLKRGSSGQLDFISPLPCPFNYGSVPALMGLDGDFLDAVVLGSRLAVGQQVKVPVLGVIRMMDSGAYDDKLICGFEPMRPWKMTLILLYFKFYALAKYILNLAKGRTGKNRCEGWHDVQNALAMATTVTKRAVELDK